VSLADLVVLGGCAAIESAAKKAGHPVQVRFTPGRVDASLEQTDVNSFEVLEPAVDGFRNYIHQGAAGNVANAMIDKANLLMLTAPEMTVLVGGMRALGATSGNLSHGVLTTRPGTLTPDFFVNLLDMRTAWKPVEGQKNLFQGTDRKTGAQRWTATLADLIFGSNAQLRALSEVYAARDGEAHFLQDFVRAWTKVMNLDRFDVRVRKAA
jgi:catalase-peroxidase